MPPACSMFSVAIIALAAFPAAAQDAGELFLPTQSAPIRTDPPAGFWRVPGDQVAETVPGNSYVVLDNVTIQSGVGSTQTWVRIAPIDLLTGSIADPEGWVYYGAGEESPNFSQVPAEAVDPVVRGLVFEQIGQESK